MNELLRRLLFLPDQASSVARDVDAIHYVIILTTFAGAIGIFAVAIFFVVRYRRRSPNETTPKVTAKPWLEAVYVGAPLALFLGLFLLGFRLYVHVNTPPPDAMDVYVTAKQWMWKFTYPGGASAIGTLRVPAGRDVRLLLTSRDVIHSFYVPAFRLKQDAIPGRYTQIWFRAVKPGSYRIMCAEYCGLRHSGMWGEIVVLEPEAFARWLEGQPPGAERPGAAEAPRELPEPPGDLVARGRRAAARLGCLKCHTIDGSPHIGPTWLDLYLRREELASGETVIADEPYLTESMMRPSAKIVAGFADVMPSFLGRIEAAEAAALVEYIKSLRSANLERAETEGGPGDRDR